MTTHSVTLQSAQQPLVLSVDIGSSSARAILFDRTGREIVDSTTQISHELTATDDGGLVFDANDICLCTEQAIDGTLDGLDPSSVSIAAVGTSCFWHSLLGLDHEGHPVTPVYHLADTRSSQSVDWLRAEYDEEEWRARVGTVFHSSYWAAKLLWMQQAEPGSWAGTSRWTSVADYLARIWLNADWTSLCMASGTGMCNLTAGDWDPGMAEITGTSIESLAPIVDRTSNGRLLDTYAARWPLLADAIWFPALGDGACANVGSGAVDNTAIALTVGTTAAMRILADRPVGTQVEIYPDLWAYRLDANTVVYGAAITNGGMWLDWISELFEDPDLIQDVSTLHPAEHGLTILPFLEGERAPLWNDNARAVIAGLSSSSTRDDIARAALEALAHRLAILHEDVAPIASDPHLIVANGAAILRSDLLRQITADTMAHEIVTISSDIESSARGAALLALQGSGIIQMLSEADNPTSGATITTPDPELEETYANERQRQEQLRSILYPGYSAWDRRSSEQ